MARKQSDYLADILGEDEAPSPAPAPTRSRPTTLLNRESALDRVRSGEVRQVTQLLLDPERVRVWAGNARIQAKLDEENCRDLIDSLVAEGGQKVPAVVRRVEDDPDHDYEVIAGTRRHWSISWLRAHSYPEMRFLAQVAVLDDEAAFRLADIENRARKDISDVERARNYAAALASHYGGRQKRMAERLRVSEGWLSKMLRVATIPDEVLSAFASLDELGLKPAYGLAQTLSDRSSAQRVQARARGLATEQSARAAAGEASLGTAEVLKRLLDAAKPPSAATPAEDLTYLSRHGRAALSVQSVNRQGLTIRLHAGSGADADELAEALRSLLARLDAEGRGLRR
ncbi:MAG: chromosome partitioning protein ParB [Rhodovulum sulfidophilum]|uniref:Chromosome partitioning protein ParB n=1 Tax=Rhodovulum sulfidophilum TaxID=35806 RepID=A0A2W5QF66_RHOSU|nr:MAG: chromosome partitioning protein ParB [Rhodovulum sulfidophilum]